MADTILFRSEIKAFVEAMYVEERRLTLICSGDLILRPFTGVYKLEN